MVKYHVVEYDNQYLKRQFLGWTDAELKQRRAICLKEALMIEAEMKRRAK